MLSNSHTFLQHLLKRKFPLFVLLMILSTAGHSQIAPLPKDGFLNNQLNAAFIDANKSPVRVRVSFNAPPYKVYTIRKADGLMYWPLFPLTPAQIEARDRKYEQSLGQQIAAEVVNTAVNNLIYGSKKPVAARPKF